MARLSVLVGFLALAILVVGGYAMTGAQEPVVEIVNDQGTPCADLTPIASPEIEGSQEIIPPVPATEGEVASPEASPVTVVVESCAPLDGTPAT